MMEYKRYEMSNVSLTAFGTDEWYYGGNLPSEKLLGRANAPNGEIAVAQKNELVWSDVRTPLTSLQFGCYTLSHFIKNGSVRKAEAIIKLWIINLNELVNLKRPLNEAQINECARLIVDYPIYRNLKESDLKVIFERAKRGEYGKLYETLSIEKIIGWFKDYMDERCEAAAEISQRIASRYKYVAERSSGAKREFKSSNIGGMVSVKKSVDRYAKARKARDGALARSEKAQKNLKK